MTPKTITRSKRALIDYYGAFAMFTLVAVGFCCLWVFTFVRQPASVNNIVIAAVVCGAFWIALTWQLRLNFAKISPIRMFIEQGKVILMRPLPKQEKKTKYSKIDKVQRFEQVELPFDSIAECSVEKHTIIIKTIAGMEFKQEYVTDANQVADKIRQNLSTV